ncbi:MAG: hypothetical protein IIA40_08160 [SAR324 cluster bacterium]|nr:hypothetical protein [SAR324 cluster bacterium]
MSAEWIDYLGWRGVRLSRGRVSLVIAPDIGGRVISLCLDGVEVMFTLAQMHGRTIDAAAYSDVVRAKKELGWLHYGGYKTWLAPQARWTEALPFLDLDSGSYDVAVEEAPGADTVTLTSPVCRETGAQLSRAVTVDDTGRVTLRQGLINRSHRPFQWGIWDVTQVRGPGLAILPTSADSGFAGGVKAYESEGQSAQVMARYVQPHDGLATVTCREVEPFKYGTDSRAGWLLGLLEVGGDRWLAYLKRFEADPGAAYPHGCDVEVYDSGEFPYFELEVHSPLHDLGPGQSCAFPETWTLDWMPKHRDPRRWLDWIAAAIKGR